MISVLGDLYNRPLLHFDFQIPKYLFQTILFNVLFMPSFVSSHLSSATYLTHLRKVCKLDDTAAVWPDPSVDAVDTHVSLHIC